jgi:hypothetical protein
LQSHSTHTLSEGGGGLASSPCNNKNNGGGSEVAAAVESGGPPSAVGPLLGQPTLSERLCRQQKRHQRRRDRAIFIDRFSRVFFPLSFSVLNIMYWTVFVENYF